jgi:predicted DNA-binding transcriptional regulator YafY
MTNTERTIKLSADERLRRLLAAIPWIVEEEGPTVDEVCRRFGYTETELATDLNLLFVCGVYPFTPDSLMEAEIADGRVWIRYADYFARPLRLTPQEGLAVLSAGRALMALPGSESNTVLARALDKLAAVLGIDPEETLEVNLGPTDLAFLDPLRDTVKDKKRIQFDYYSYGRDQWNHRTVEPRDVYAAAGEWYVLGFDNERNAERLFRIDRMRNLNVTDETFEYNGSSERLIYEADPSDRLISIDLPREEWWVIDYYPNEGVEQLTDSIRRVQLSISGLAFLERLLLRLGAHVESQGTDGVASAAAKRVLTRYK